MRIYWVSKLQSGKVTKFIFKVTEWQRCKVTKFIFKVAEWQRCKVTKFLRDGQKRKGISWLPL
jgi:hypothetical protein